MNKEYLKKNIWPEVEERVRLRGRNKEATESDTNYSKDSRNDIVMRLIDGKTEIIYY